MVGLVSAPLFAAIVLLIQAQGMNSLEHELRRTAVNALSRPLSQFDYEEFRRDNPDIEVAIFDERDDTVQGASSLVEDPTEGLERLPGKIVYGIRRGDRIVVFRIGTRPVDNAARHAAFLLAALWPVLVAAAGAIGYWAASSSFRPLEHLAQQAMEASVVGSMVRLDTQDEAEFRHFTDQLNVLLERIGEASRREERFAEDAAHELRTPLATMQTRLEGLLLRERSPKEYRDAAESLLQETERMIRIVEMLLESAGRPAAERAACDGARVVSLAAERWRPKMREHGLELAWNAQPLSVGASEEEFSTIVDNLLSNAFKYARTSVRVRLAEEDGRALLSVQDDGPGIPAAFRTQLFDRFFRLDPSRSRSSGGSGIGLAIVRRLVEGRGGSIAVEDGPGASFLVRLPLASHPSGSDGGP